MWINEERMLIQIKYKIRMLSNSAGMNQQSVASFNKISLEMQKLSQLITQEQQYKQQLKHALQNASLQDSSDSALSNLDLYFQEYNNPTTKSLPFEPDNEELASQILEGDSQTINNIYRNRQIDFSQEADRDNFPDDKSTVILAALKVAEGKEKLDNIPNPNASLPNYSSLEYESKAGKTDGNLSKLKKSSSKNATSSMPSESCQRQHYKSQNHFTKNSSITKNPQKIESPVMGLSKNKKMHPLQQEPTRDFKAKLTKISKIDREELSKLQEKKMQKKTELSSNRKKTKRGLGTAKSSSNMISQPKMCISTANYISQKSTSNFINQKSHGNSSSKKFEYNKRDLAKKDEKIIMLNHQDWQRMDKTSKKLNRVNICKLQQNIKKANQKKYGKELSANKIQKKYKKAAKFQSYHRNKNELKLHFTEGDQECPMKKLIEEKNLSRQYAKQNEKYLNAAKNMSKTQFQTLLKECRQASEEAILKIKLLSLIIYFFDQFCSASLLTHQRFNPKTDQFFTCIPEEEIIEVLLHPKKIIKVIETLPSILMNDNAISSQRIQLFLMKFSEVNEQLDQQLQFFLIKKGILYSFVHALSQFVTFLVQTELVAQTKRSRIVPINSNEPLHGFYSGRSKRQQNSQKYIKKSEGAHKLGFRCDSDRKITLEDEDFCWKQVSKATRKQAAGKHPIQLKKVLK